tara:strand:+ start:421 stop:1239 length:819 start_codon:yes stop_codon:yes gene_type:complete
MSSLRILLAVLSIALASSIASGIEIQHTSTFNKGEFYAVTNGDKSPNSLYQKTQNYLRPGDSIQTDITLDLESLKLLDEGSSKQHGKWKTYGVSGSYSVKFGKTQFKRTSNLALKLSVNRDSQANVSNLKLSLFQRDFSHNRSYGNMNYLSGGLLDTDIKYQQDTQNTKARINPLATNISIQLRAKKNLHAAAITIFNQNNLEAIFKNPQKSTVDVRLVLANNERTESIISLNQDSSKGEFSVLLTESTSEIEKSRLTAMRSQATLIDLRHF